MGIAADFRRILFLTNDVRLKKLEAEGLAVIVLSEFVGHRSGN